MEKYKITSDNKGQRLDLFLCEKKSDLSRSKIQKRIKAGDILVNNKKTTVHHFLKVNDIITTPEQASVPAMGPRTKPAMGTKKLPTSDNKATPEINVINETNHYLIVNKPAGLLVHEAPGRDEKTMVDIILKKYPAITKIGEDPMRPGLVHRLDKEVSGLLVVAKIQDMFDHLKKQFKSRQIKKEYTALVHGCPEKSEGEITFNIDRSETEGHKMAAVPDDRGRHAATEFEIIEKLGNYTLLKIKPRTGRTHQIRVHLNAYGLPIVGDLTYRPKKLKAKIKMQRIFLHADFLGFKDLNNKWQEFKLPLPAELQNILDDMKKG